MLRLVQMNFVISRRLAAIVIVIVVLFAEVTFSASSSLPAFLDPIDKVLVSEDQIFGDSEKRFVTHGWEIEYFPGPKQETTLNLRDIAYQLDSYLSTNLGPDVENSEVRSVGGERQLSEIREQLSEMYSQIGENNIRSIQLHMRVPKSLVMNIRKDVMLGWLGQVSDAIFSWRLTNTRPRNSLGERTVRPQYYFQLDNPGTLKVVEMPEYWDLEIRGFMKNIDMLLFFARLILTGLKNPEWVRPHEYQNIILKSRLNILNDWDHLKSRPEYERLDEWEFLRSKLRDNAILLKIDLPRRVWLPLDSIENFSKLSNRQKDLWKISRLDWRAKMAEVLENSNQDVNTTLRAIGNIFRQWAVDTQAFETLTSKLLDLKSAGQHNYDRPLLQRNLNKLLKRMVLENSSDSLASEWAHCLLLDENTNSDVLMTLLNKLSSWNALEPTLRKTVMNYLNNAPPKFRRDFVDRHHTEMDLLEKNQAISSFMHDISQESLEVLKKLHVEGTGGVMVEVLTQRQDPESLEYMKQYLIDPRQGSMSPDPSRYPFRISHMARALVNRKGPGAANLRALGRQHSNPLIRDMGLKGQIKNNELTAIEITELSAKLLPTYLDDLKSSHLEGHGTLKNRSKAGSLELDKCSKGI